MDTRELTIEGITFEVAPTPVAKLTKAQAVFSANAMATEAGIEAMIEALFWGIKRARGVCEKSGAITLEWLKENIDAHNIGEVFKVFADVNMMKQRSADEPSGEAPAASAS